MLFSYQNQVLLRRILFCFPLKIYFLRTIVQNHEKNHAKFREQYAGNSEKNREKRRQYSHDYYHWVMKSPEYREKIRAYQKAYRQRKKAGKAE